MKKILFLIVAVVALNSQELKDTRVEVELPKSYERGDFA